MNFLPAKRITTSPGHHYFGYYDKCPWDSSGRYFLSMEVDFIDRPPTPDDKASIGMMDLESGEWIPLDETLAWNWQQSTMLQWLGDSCDGRIVYNVREDDQYRSLIRNVHTGETRILPRPIYAASRDGKSAVTLNFSRVNRTRPGYGYNGVPDDWQGELHPSEDGIYWQNLETGDNRLIITLDQIVNIGHDDTMDGAEHWFNHLQFCRDDSRFLFLHRWRKGERGSYTRLFTAYPDGSDIRCIADHELVSHFDWKDGKHILAWARKYDVGDFFFLYEDQSENYEIIGEGVMVQDGHCSYSPDESWILNDTYPDSESMRTLYLYHPGSNQRFDVGRFLSPPEISGEIRCDLHPRWNRDGTRVCFDSAHEGERQIYEV
ncbi:MAG: hypothetical protein QF886_23595, partial [Planctomycetota bacterium]|nr:hypothetical protein [Planctomycetota bacterium]